MSECSKASHYLFNQKKAKALIVSVVVSFDEFLGKMAQKSVDVPFVENKATTVSNFVCLGSLYIFSLIPRILFFLIPDFLFSLGGQGLEVSSIFLVFSF